MEQGRLELPTDDLQSNAFPVRLLFHIRCPRIELGSSVSQTDVMQTSILTPNDSGETRTRILLVKSQVHYLLLRNQ